MTDERRVRTLQIIEIFADDDDVEYYEVQDVETNEIFVIEKIEFESRFEKVVIN